MTTRARPSFGLTVLAVSLPMFMVALDNLVVTNALASIRSDLGSSLENLQWVTNAYVLGFAGLLLTAAGLGDRFGRRRVFLTGTVAFTLASVGCGLSNSTELLILFRALQGISASAVLPLSLTLLTVAVPQEKRGLAIGLWSAISSLAVALAPLVGGAITTGLDWHFIFLLNIPVGLVAVPLALKVLGESQGVATRLDVPGLVLAGGGVLALVWAIVNAGEDGWTSGGVLAAFAGAAVLLLVFLAWERRTDAPLLPLGLYRIRAFSLANLVSLAVFFGLFGPIFLIAQYLQVARDHSAFVAGLWTLPWAVMPMLIAPFAGKLAPKVGGGPLMAAGLAVSGIGLAWFAAVADVSASDWEFVAPFVLAGAGMGLVFAPTATVVMGSVPPQQVGKASGANTTVRELGGALGIAAVTSIFAANGDYTSPERFTEGMTPGLWVGVAVLAVGALLALGIPRPKKTAPAQPPAAAPAKEEVLVGE
ncbi:MULTISPECIES: DHA2 family efflux MFS transporter permease subunit [unclassified Streptomyces]|uniref:DHA2 family efflux MFS transporter permease subunit n=1 Tax=unclassified Streptomyces TaxID=2593676 RepID=UPI002E8022A5|nr:DHA2 family efflux MFS transporter permease subunit [Streptomyces sp. NBC_00589]WTI38556.1 DHA2 family efflux MFS transporter permease subunit [Streptomyces sp. NBC_00775]WUB27765.1 DHA2 family efflux MFS transporter permease subunit [Streptomyces sp. NBC_00589]